jgi:hypothetical protein
VEAREVIDGAPLAGLATFDALLREAAKTYPRAILSPERMSFSGLDSLADHYTARWREALTRIGDATVLVAAPTAQSFAALVAALRAGLALSLAPPEIRARELDAAIVAADATLLAGPVRFAGFPIGDLMSRVALDQERVSLVAIHGGGLPGVLALDEPRENYSTYAPRSAGAQIRLAPTRGGPSARFDEGELIGAAGTIVRAARIAPGDAILTTLSCASAAGLVAGPLAALVAGARLNFHAPFDTRAFLAALDAAAPVHLVVPEAVAPSLEAAGLLNHGRIASLILSCASDPEAPAFDEALGDAPVLYVSAGPWGGVRVETAPQMTEPDADNGRPQ